MESPSAPLLHSWDAHRLAATILSSWVREVHDGLPAWTPPRVFSAYRALLESLEDLKRATQQAAREDIRRHA